MFFSKFVTNTNQSIINTSEVGEDLFNVNVNLFDSGIKEKGENKISKEE